jgi:putative phage-type endonuclease
MQIIKDIEQGSDEWLQLRLGVATASNFDKIITTTGKQSATLEKYALKLATDLMLSSPEPSYKNNIMERGNELEPLARQAYQEETFSIVEEIAMFKSDCNNFGYSPDGLVGEDGLIEIKCPLATTHFQYIIDDKTPIVDYWQQLQGGLWVSGRKYIDFVSYHPNFKTKQLFVKRVERDEDYIAKLAELANKTILVRNELLNKMESE